LEQQDHKGHKDQVQQDPKGHKGPLEQQDHKGHKVLLVDHKALEDHKARKD
jgi:hypothetical protein